MISMSSPILQLISKQAQSLKQIQRLIMTPQMQQALHLLQLPILELSTLVEMELEQNPVLESVNENEGEDLNIDALEADSSEESENLEQNPEKALRFDDQDFDVLKQMDEDFREHFSESTNFTQRNKEEEQRQAYMESSIVAETTLFNYLMKQAHDTFETDEELAIAEALIGNFDENGFLKVNLEEIALLTQIDIKKIQKVIVEIQDFEPFGVGAQNLQESLLIQLRCLAKKQTLAYKIVDQHYDDLLHNRIPTIQKGLKCSPEEIYEALERHISKLDLHPGVCYSHQIIQSIVPDVTLRLEKDELIVEVNDEAIPSLKINHRYLRMLDDETQTLETKDFIKNKIISAKWLLKNIYQRNETIQRIAESLAERQKEFFLNPEGKLVPLTMKTISEELGLHESTIARAVNSKYIETPRGLFSLRFFFTNAYLTNEGDISSKTVKQVLLEILEDEEKQKPLSDEAISNAIKARGIPCARRTVAKYRAELKIGNAQQRKRF
jgi:RNA polymerase sigma-54 factor